MSADEYVPELGDWITLESVAYGTTTGRITYRSPELIRIVPTNDSTRCVDFPLNPETGEFQEALHVTALAVHEKRKDPHFAVQLGVVIGDLMECFDTEGHLIPEGGGTVADILTDDEYDAIVLDTPSGKKVLNFAFVGSDEYPVLRGRSAPDLAASAENESATPPSKKPRKRTTKATHPKGVSEEGAAEGVAAGEEIVIGSEGPMVEKADEGEGDEAEGDEDEGDEDEADEGDLAASDLGMIEFVEEKDQLFSDALQREDMFNGLLLDVRPARKQRQPATIQAIYRTTDLLLHLKRSVVRVDEQGAVIPGAEPVSYVATTLQDALQKQTNGEPLPSLVPVAALKRVLFFDQDARSAGTSTDIEAKYDYASIAECANAPSNYEKEALGQKKFAQYITASLKPLRPFVPMGDSTEPIRIDQDALHTRVPLEKVKGFHRGLPHPFSPSYEFYVPLTPESITDVNTSMVRLLSATRIQLTSSETPLLVAPADAAETVGHVFLSSELAARRAPMRSSVLLWDIQASDRSRSAKDSFFAHMISKWADQKTLPTGAEPADILPALQTRIQPMLSFWNRTTASILDSLGLSNLELTPALLAPFVTSMADAQAAWRASYTSLVANAVARDQQPSVPLYPPIASEASALFSAELLQDDIFGEVYRMLAEKETTLREYDLALANRILREAGATLAPLWYALAGDVPPEYAAMAERRFIAESGRERRNRAVQFELAKKFKATPRINPCRHVQRLERVMSVREDMQRMKLFKQFLKEYQAGNDGNWKQCGRCSEHLVCKHEVLLLHEFQEPDRSAMLHKTLLLEYASPYVFEGAFICKNCGQKIQEIEYDNSIEFDADGRPMVGRTDVVPDEEDDLGLREEGLAYKGEDLKLYNDLQSLFYACGIPVTEETFKRLVAAAKECFRAMINERAKYDSMKVPPGVIKPSYDAYVATNKVAIMGALMLLELQTSEKDITEPFPACAFSASGFPLEGLPSEGVNALSYASCLVAKIDVDKEPWNATKWSPLSGPKREQEVRKNILNATYSVLGLLGPKDPVGSRPPIPAVSDAYNARLEAKRRQQRQQQEQNQEAGTEAAVRERLPPSFRPLPTAVRVAETSIGNRATFEANLEEKDVSETGPVIIKRQTELSHNIVADFYAAALGDKTRSDTSCCFKQLSESTLGFGLLSLGYEEARMKEIALLEDAFSSLSRKDPTASGAGTHLFVPWSSPRLAEQSATADASVYYKLFLKHCFRGRNIGSLHEFVETSTGSSVCRQCNFTLPVELLYATNADQRIALATAALAAAEVAFDDEERFRDLELRIRERRSVLPPTPSVPRSLQQILDSFETTPLLEDQRTAWTQFKTAMVAIHRPEFDPKTRLATLAPFNTGYGDTREALGERLKACLGGGVKARRRVEPFFIQFEAVTKNSVGGVSLRTLNEVLAVAGYQIAKDLSRETDLKLHIEKWIPNISNTHKAELRHIWSVHSADVRFAIREKAKLSEQANVVCTTVAERFAVWYGRWNRQWSTEFRPNAEMLEDEYTNAVQFAAAAGILALLTPDSPLYEGVQGEGATEDDLEAVCHLFAEWLVASFKTMAAQISDYQMTREEIDAVLQREAEKERRRFIKEFDDLSPELRQVELIKKRNKIGRWSRGNNLFTYDPSRFDAQLQERNAQQGEENSVIENDHYAAQDED